MQKHTAYSTVYYICIECVYYASEIYVLLHTVLCTSDNNIFCLICFLINLVEAEQTIKVNINIALYAPSIEMIGLVKR